MQSAAPGITGQIAGIGSTTPVQLTVQGTALNNGVTVRAMAGNSGKLYVGQQVASTAAAWQAGHTYALGAVVKVNGGVYVCTTAGDSAGSGGPTGTGAGIVDNTAKWDYQSTYQISALNAFELNASESHFFRVSDASTLFVLGSAANQVVAFEGS